MQILKVFVSSPGDVEAERQRVGRVVARLNGEFREVVRLKLIRWEEHFYTADRSFQEQIAETAETDLVICILWSRIGSPLPPEARRRSDSSTYESGTVYEVETALASKRQTGTPDIYVFRKTAEVRFSSDDAKLELERTQFRLLETFWQKWFKSPDGHFTAAFQTFATTDAFEEQLEACLRQWLETKGHVASGPVWDIRIDGSPFRGLEPFEAQHERVFFGRRLVVERCRERLVEAAAGGTAFLLVLGASGSGKSSLVRAGLVPRLTLPGVVEGVDLWRRCIIRPGAHPLAALAKALFEEEALPELAGGDFPSASALAEPLQAHPPSAVRLLGRALERAAEAQRQKEGYDRPVSTRLLLVLDQLEELFLAPPEIQAAFAQGLAALARSGSVWVVATLRSDRYGGLSAEPTLMALKEAGASFDLPLPGESELEEIIRAPVRAAGLNFDSREEHGPDLGDELKAAMRSMDALPLLQMTLEALFAERDRETNTLSVAAYDRLGRLEGTIASRVEQAYAALSPSAQAELPALLRAMVDSFTDQGGVITQEVLREAFVMSGARAELVDRLVADRLLVAERGDTIRVAHDALLRHWQRAQKLLEGERDFIRLRERLEPAVADWRAHGGADDPRAAGYLLMAGPLLAAAEQLRNQEAGRDLPAEMITFIDQSGAADKRARTRKLRRLYAVVASLAVLFAAAVAGAWYARMQEQEAVRQWQTAQRNESRALASLAENEVERSSPATAVRLALAALPARLDSPDRAYAREAEGALLYSVQHMRERRRFPHEGIVWSVAFSPDGRTLATGSSDKTARLWEVATGKQIGVLRGHEQEVSSVAFSPDGRTLATGSSDKTARLWEVATGKQIGVLRGHEQKVSSVAFSPDGRTLATGSSDKTARLWEVATGKQIGVLRGHEQEVSSVAFSPDGRTLATGSSDKTARLWEVATGKQIGVLRGHEQKVSSVAFSPDGRTLATGSSDKTARLWEVATGKQIGVLGHEGSVQSVAFSPDGRTLATAGSWDKTARLWEVLTGKQIGVLRGHEHWVLSVAFSPDGRTLATAGSLDNTARLWEVTAGKEIGVLRGHENFVWSVAFSPDGRTLATGSSDKTARLWEVLTGKQIGVLGHEGSVQSVAFSPDGRTLATGSSDKTARLWEVATGTEIDVLRGHENFVWSIAFSPDGRTLATGSLDNTARLWEVATGKQIGELRGHEGSVSSVAFSPDGRTLATGSADKTARLWEVATGKQIGELRGHEKEVVSIAFSPDGRTLATGSADKTARLWEVATGKQIGELGHEQEVLSVAFSPDGRTLATGSLDNTARLWEVATGTEIGVLRGHENFVWSIAFSPDGRTLATGSWDNTARLWELVEQSLVDLACARVRFLPLSEKDRQRFGITKEWCTPEVSAELRAKLRLDEPKNLGIVLATLDERESGTKRLEAAVDTYRASLQERTRERVPLYWAMTQNNLGIVLATLGERESDTKRLEEAVDAYRAALQERTRERVPLQWAQTQNNLGTALATLGERESDTKRLEAAIDAHRAALQERTRERVPLQWAQTQNNLGTALATLGERESDTKRLEAAIDAYRAALQERTRERVPLQWAQTQNNLGTALATLGEQESDTKRLEAAAASFSNVLQVDPDNGRAYDGAQFLYHEKLFAFAKAFDLNQAWLKRHPDDFEAQDNFAEAVFTVGRFAEAEQRLAALLDRPQLEPGTEVALRVLEICSLVALDRPDTLRAKLGALGDLLKGNRDEPAGDWTFAGSRHFIDERPELSRHPWLIRLLAAVVERNAANALAAVGDGQAASAAAAAQ